MRMRKKESSTAPGHLDAGNEDTLDYTLFRLGVRNGSTSSINTMSTYMSGLGSTLAYVIGDTLESVLGLVAEVRLRLWLRRYEKIFQAPEYLTYESTTERSKRHLKILEKMKMEDVEEMLSGLEELTLTR